jgi:membrane fusion protein, heavy metal efflux system
VKNRKPVLAFFLALWTGGCGSPIPRPAAEDAVHSHDGTTHSHADEEASVAVTLWTNHLELFMEYPVLRAGRPAKFAVHLTKLGDFEPLSQGPALFRFTKAGASPKMVTVGAPEVAGIFGPTVTFDEAGEYRLHLEVLTDEMETSLEYGPIRVLGTSEKAPSPEDPPPAGQVIVYLKEQQWKLPFATMVADRRGIRRTIRIPARIRAKTGLESVVSAAVGGRYSPPEGGTPRLGQRIRAGDLLGYVELLPVERSSLLDRRVGAGVSMSRLTQEVAEAASRVTAEEARLRLAERETRRVRTLVEAEALPQKRLEEAESELEVREASLWAAREALANYRTALSRYEASEIAIAAIDERLPLTAPVAGQLVESHAVPGAYVDAREELFRIVDVSTVWAEGQVFENDLAGLDDLRGATLSLPGLDAIDLERDELILVGSTLHPTSRTLPVVFEVGNPDRRIKIGALGRLELQTGGTITALAVPASAVLLEENRSVVYVQHGGESFERRIVKTGIQDRQWIEILEGLAEGERIVTEGAYDVALAARSTEVPEHGHVH